MPYKFREDISIADVAFDASGKNLTELFQSAAEAVIDSMANTKTIKPLIIKEIKKHEENVEKLLFEFLEEIIYLKDAESMVFHDIKVKVDEKKMEATAVLRGDKINPAKQELHQDVKAVTMHYYKVEKDKIWRTQVVLDI